MKWLIVLAAILTVSYCTDETDEVDLSERQYDCQYMWMMMNSGNGPTVTGLGLGLLVGVAAATALFSGGMGCGTLTVSKRL